MLSLSASEEKLPLLSFSALQVLIRTLSLIFSRLAVTALSACPHTRDASGSLIVFMAFCWTLSSMSVSLVLGSLELDRELLHVWPYEGWVGGNDHLLYVAEAPECPGTSVPCLAHTNVLMPWVKCGCVRLSSESAWNDTWLKFLIALLFRSNQMTAQPIAVLSYVKTQHVSSFKCQQEFVMKCEVTQAKSCGLLCAYFTCYS